MDFPDERLTELINLADILSLIEFFFFLAFSWAKWGKEKHSKIVELVCQSFDIIKVATQFFEELKTAVLALQLLSFQNWKCDWKTVGSLPILLPLPKPSLFILKGP